MTSGTALWPWNVFVYIKRIRNKSTLKVLKPMRHCQQKHDSYYESLRLGMKKGLAPNGIRTHDRSLTRRVLYH